MTVGLKTVTRIQAGRGGMSLFPMNEVKSGAKGDTFRFAQDVMRSVIPIVITPRTFK